MKAVGAQRERTHGFRSVEVFANAVDDAALHQVDDAVGEQLGVNTELPVVAQRRHDRVRYRPDPALDRGPVGNPIGNVLGDCVVERPRCRRFNRHERPVRTAPPRDLADVQLIASERARHVFGDFQEEATTADETRGVVGGDPQGEVAVPIRGRCSRDDERVVDSVSHDLVHLGEVRRYEPDIAGGEVRPRDVRQEVRDVPEPITELAGEIPPVVDRVHLVDQNAIETVGCVLDRIEHRCRLSVPEGDDDLRPSVDVCEHIT